MFPPAKKTTVIGICILFWVFVLASRAANECDLIKFMEQNYNCFYIYTTVWFDCIYHTRALLCLFFLLHLSVVSIVVTYQGAYRTQTYIYTKEHIYVKTLISATMAGLGLRMLLRMYGEHFGLFFRFECINQIRSFRLVCSGINTVCCYDHDKSWMPE